jgi:hypothetical protein
MFMTEYIREIKRQFRDVYGFISPPGSSNPDLMFDEGRIPDGEYPMTIDGKVDHVRIVRGALHSDNITKCK